MDRFQIQRKARYAVVKFARDKWGAENVLKVSLNMVTAWEDQNGFSRWAVALDGFETKDIQVSNSTFEVELLGEPPVQAEEPEDEVEIEFMRRRTEIIRQYKVTNAKPFTTINTYRPASVKFTFVDGDLTDTQVYGYLINEKNGAVADHVSPIPGIYSYDTTDWPSWLVKMRDRVSVHGLAGVD